MSRVLASAVAGAATVLLLAGCGERVVDLPVDRAAAAPVQLDEGALRCPGETVAYGDGDPRSGAGAVPADFAGQTVLTCDVDLMSARVRGGVEQLRVRQTQAPLTPELRTALDLPDQETRPRGACAASQGGFTTVYLLDGQRRAIRVLLPREDPCQQIRTEVVALLPGDGGSDTVTFWARRPSR